MTKEKSVFSDGEDMAGDAGSGNTGNTGNIRLRQGYGGQAGKSAGIEGVRGDSEGSADGMASDQLAEAIARQQGRDAVK